MYVIEDYKEDDKWVISKTSNKVRYWTTSGVKWQDMKTRCRKFKRNGQPNPNYNGAFCEFEDFQDFVEWSCKQVGYAHGFELDKDILASDNIIKYSKENCVFVPKEINLFAQKEISKNGLPIGVSLVSNTTAKVFRARCNNGVKVINLGCYETPAEAFEIYKSFKKSVASQLACKWKGKIDQRVYDKLINYEVLHVSN